jgi:hypothetical protein
VAIDLPSPDASKATRSLHVARHLGGGAAAEVTT